MTAISNHDRLSTDWSTDAKFAPRSVRYGQQRHRRWGTDGPRTALAAAGLASEAFSHRKPDPRPGRLPPDVRRPGRQPHADRAGRGPDSANAYAPPTRRHAGHRRYMRDSRVRDQERLAARTSGAQHRRYNQHRQYNRAQEVCAEPGVAAVDCIEAATGGW